MKSKLPTQHIASLAWQALRLLRVRYRSRSESKLEAAVGQYLTSIERVVLWTAEMHLVAITGAQDAFIGTAVPSFPVTKAELWWLADFAMPMYTAGHEVLPDGSIKDEPDATTCCYLTVEGEAGIFNVAFVHKDGDIELGAPEVFRSGSVVTKRSIAGILAMKAFMEIKLSALEIARPPRQERRRLEKSGLVVPDIRIVQLREREKGEGGSETTREYHHRWIVKGHWRRLHEPRKADGAEVTFVDAYVKGPDSAPLLPARESVYVVAR